MSDVSNYGWNKKGEEVIFNVKIPNKIKNVRVSIIAAVSKNRKIGYQIHKDSVNGDKFNDFVNYIRKKTRSKNYYLDNAAIRRTQKK